MTYALFKSRFKEQIAQCHLSDEKAVDMDLIRVEEQLTINQQIYVRGVLTKKNGVFTLNASNTCKLTLSARPIDIINVTSKEDYY